MASEITEVNYLKAAEELCIYDVLPKKGSFHYLVMSDCNSFSQIEKKDAGLWLAKKDWDPPRDV